MRSAALIIACILVAVFANAAEWSNWRYMGESKGVTLKYRSIPYGEKMRVEWVAKNNNSESVDIKFVKVYTTSTGKQITLTGYCSDLRGGHVFDPAADHILGTNFSVEVTMSVVK